MNNPRQYDWANLPKELLNHIAIHLRTRIDVFRFRAVCTSWRSSIPITHHQSSLSPFFTRVCRAQNSTTTFLPYTICRLYSATEPGPSSLIKVLELPSGDLHLLNPLFVYSNIERIPGITVKSVNLLNFKVVEIYNGYHLKVKNNKMFHAPFLKWVFDSDCSSSILGVSINGRLGFRGFSDRSWTRFGNNGTHYDDLIIFKGRFYVVDNWGTVSWINTNDDDDIMKIVQYYPPLYGCGQLKNLIESDGGLYVVDSYVDSERWRTPVWEDKEIDRVDWECVRMDMRVYRFDEEMGTWAHVQSLGDQVFVLGVDYCFAFHRFPGCEGNCIYFMEPRVGGQRKDLRNYLLWVFRLDDRSIKRVSSLPCHMKLFSPSMIWSFFT